MTILKKNTPIIIKFALKWFFSNQFFGNKSIFKSIWLKYFVSIPTQFNAYNCVIIDFIVGVFIIFKIIFLSLNNSLKLLMSCNQLNHLILFLFIEFLYKYLDFVFNKLFMLLLRNILLSGFIFPLQLPQIR